MLECSPADLPRNQPSPDQTASITATGIASSPSGQSANSARKSPIKSVSGRAALAFFSAAGSPFRFHIPSLPYPAPIDSAKPGWKAALLSPYPGTSQTSPPPGTSHPCRCAGSTNPCPSFGYTTNCVGTCLVPQRMPELKRLRRRTFPVSVPHHHQRRRLHLLDVVDRRTLRIHRRIVVHATPQNRESSTGQSSSRRSSSPNLRCPPRQPPP